MTTAAFKAKLEQLGLPAREIKVFGVIRMNVHVHCDGLETANKWAAALASVLGTVRVVKSLRETASVRQNGSRYATEYLVAAFG